MNVVKLSLHLTLDQEYKEYYELKGELCCKYLFFYNFLQKTFLLDFVAFLLTVH